MDRPWIYDATITDWLMLFILIVVAYLFSNIIEQTNKELTRRIKQLENEIEMLTGKRLQ